MKGETQRDIFVKQLSKKKTVFFHKTCYLKVISLVSDHSPFPLIMMCQILIIGVVSLLKAGQSRFCTLILPSCVFVICAN